ncbi:uncharacterized protein LOC108916131 [Anoplophora glabripennis]|uniref:uncharacterized protein LOC108916131 n=1 Tax=Anoplophora glabripennis TaxID=217634 RepID=UPI000874A9BB|nr:uncharacterized protein LOC108916131 [Anoplophora glabripennis]
MERVLKRVGLSKRTQSDVEAHMTNLDENVKVRRRRRSKSRRRPSQENKKTRGLFNIDWDSVKDCKSCKSRAITRRFCSKRADNELYRSNSFKFERFIRGNEELSTLGKKISVCDDYSLPVDHLAKRRPNSIAVPNPNCNNFSEWNLSSPNDDKVGESFPSPSNVEVLDTYSTPRDSRQHLSQDENEPKCFTSPDREYSQPYTTEESSGPTSDEEFGSTGNGNANILDLNSPDSINEGLLPSTLNVLSPNKTDVGTKRHPSPYYYGDLFKYKTENSPPKTAVKNKRNQSLKQERERPESKYQNTNRRSRTNRRFRKSSSLDNPNDQREKTIRNRPQIKYKKSSSVETQSTDSRDAPNGTQMPPNPVTVAAYDEYGLDDMTRQRHVYETAFDCRISKSDDDLDQIDKVSNHPVLVQINNAWETKPGSEPSIDSSTLNRRNRARENCQKPSQEDNNTVLALSQDIQNMHLTATEENNSASSGGLPLRGYTPSPPSTAPLPTKFHGKEHMMNSIRSAPNLPSHPKSRLKDLHLPVKSMRGRSPTTSSDSLHIQIHQRSDHVVPEKDRIFEIKSRPRKDILLNKRSKDSLLEFKGRRVRHKYSSTESMTTSSSGGSMESIKSSTSEGNRSTSSSESRHSPSLSSHSSDSGGNPNNYPVPQTSAGFLAQHANKLHILSPISDKSSQEPISETSDNNRNNNSQKCSPEEVVATPETIKTKRRLPQNKNLLNLGFHTANPEIQGSDSGISIQSREGIKSRFGFTNAELSAPPSQQDFSDLPFDMPKLRRRRMLPEVACTSGSATSVDLRDLPFDMPKLRRRMRLQPSNLEASASQASSSQSVLETDRQAMCRPKLTLNLGEISMRQQHPTLGLSLTLGLNLNPTIGEITGSTETIDVNLPLEKQGWFHGSISRMEAENVLRVLREGSFLVRNSESIKHDYSLSLKSARGFMHMRIQKNSGDGCFILGQFSKPFNSIPEMIKHFSINRLPIRGAEHMCLLQPVIAQLL